MKNDSIVLIGMAGVGKSTVGALVARALQYDFTDVDEYIWQKDGKTVQQVIDEGGDQALLKLEKERVLELNLKRRVLAPGGSIIYHPDLMDYLKKNTTLVYLEDCYENIEARVKGDMHTRGIVGLKTRSLKQIYNERQPLYRQYADITIPCDSKSWEQIAEEVLKLLKNSPPSRGRG
jgi:shikimate kinase